MDLYYDIFETPIGWMGVLGSDTGLRRTTLPQASPGECIAQLGPDVDGAALAPECFEELERKLALYFQGRPNALDDEPLDLEGASPFQRAAWSACRSIPTGETRSYKWLAAEAGRPRAPRGAGQSMARNPLPIVIPCHRVIASDGTLGGFGEGSGQLDLKRLLLDLERRKV